MSFTVTVQPSGRSFQVSRDETILSAAISQGVGLPYGCKDGACGSCKCRLLQGRVLHGAHQAGALSADESEAGWALTCCAAAQTDVVIEARTVVGATDIPIRKMPVRVTKLEKLTADVALLTLQLPANDALRFQAGQYIEFLLPNNLRRAYSMANSPLVQSEKPSIELHIRHSPGGVFTDAVFATMKEKDNLRIEGPFGSFFLREESAKPIVMVASGTGFAPIKAMIEQMQIKGTQRPAVLYWGCRNLTDLYQHEWALAAAAKTANLSYVPVLSEAQPEDVWTGRTGFVHHAVMHDIPDLSAHQVYACGAPIMVSSALHDFTLKCGLPSDEFFADTFTSEADKHPTVN